MVRSKQRQLTAIRKKKINTANGHIDLSNFNNDLDWLGEDSWVIVKRQRITILVPPLPAAKNLTTQNQGPSQLQAVPRKTVSNQIHSPIDICPRMPSVDEHEKFICKKGTRFARKAPAQGMPTLAKAPRLDLRRDPENQDQADTPMIYKRFGVSNTPGVIKRQRLLHCPINFLDGGKLLNQRLRASNLERNLQKAGGLSRWLASLGLGQFVRIFQRKSVNKFQLVNLTMKKLKDMGANAVGPRRKLIHAIDCVCQPYSFQTI